VHLAPEPSRFCSYPLALLLLLLRPENDENTLGKWESRRHS
jgi:hypothetical protein